MKTSDLTTLLDCKLEWQMSNCERLAITSILQKIQPKLSLEIGTYKGGSLQALSRFSEKVISLDIDPTVPIRMKGLFENVEYRTGDSTFLVSDLVSQLNRNESHLDFILVDGDHTSKGVCNDINQLLRLIPRRRTIILMHDSFNPECRRGILSADWSNNVFVSSVELDFIPGCYILEAWDTAQARSMWGGFACAVLEPFPRPGELVIQESQIGLYNAVFKDSRHAPQRPKSLLERVCMKLIQLARG